MISIDGGVFPRLGNSAFQLAAAITLADENADTVAFPEWKYAEYFQGDFTPKESVVDSIYREPYFHYKKIDYRRNMAINGYYQSYKYWWSNRKKIQKMFTLREQYIHPTIVPEWKNITFKEDWESCSVHLRMTDYKNFPDHHPILSVEDYYLPAMLYVELCNPEKRIQFYVFSDDKPAAKEMFSKYHYSLQSPTGFNIEVVEDCDIMAYSGLSQTRHSIVGNSTFSLFPALLKDDGIKIAPSNDRWFAPALKHHDLKDLIPDDWIRL